MMIGTGTLTKQIAAYLARTGYDALDADALRATKEHILFKRAARSGEYFKKLSAP